jgi:adenosylcobyric acid synthase
MGTTRGRALERPAVCLDEGQAGGRADGAISGDGQILGTYCHGLFDHPEALAALLAWAGLREAQAVDFAARREADLERLADTVETALDWRRLNAALGAALF